MHALSPAHLVVMGAAAAATARASGQLNLAVAHTRVTARRSLVTAGTAVSVNGAVNGAILLACRVGRGGCASTMVGQEAA